MLYWIKGGSKKNLKFEEQLTLDPIDDHLLVFLLVYFSWNEYSSMISAKVVDATSTSKMHQMLVYFGFT